MPCTRHKIRAAKPRARKSKTPPKQLQSALKHSRRDRDTAKAKRLAIAEAKDERRFNTLMKGWNSPDPVERAKFERRYAKKSKVIGPGPPIKAPQVVSKGRGTGFRNIY